jgi:hypothetical protein
MNNINFLEIGSDRSHQILVIFRKTGPIFKSCLWYPVILSPQL